ncbi:glycine--tRNA ligase subunit beta [Frigidibacter sp. SD6-1]|uniref:glycine--tRNA ligase subunit beta n=1 Tax=Frigidibacter sp. SD6-1 TaxID=3032581 RepID=UPI0024E02A1B|nr:glycine--tRNA ligase subunit beta [Frigidibacter sp. SD6-1]
MPDLLIELFSEEIPARMQARAREDLRKLVTDGLVAAGLTYAGAAAFSTPRRLTLAIEGLTAESAPVREERKGPATTAPEAAIEGFLRSTGLTRDQLEVRDDKKGQVYFAVMTKSGRTAPAIVAEVLEATIRTFPWPKSMRWGAGQLRWVRPLHSILCILTTEAGAEVVPLDVDGIRAGNVTRGHRFLSKGDIAVSSFDDYVQKLKRAHVVLDSAEREAHIWADATNMAFAAGLEVVEDKGLLSEVAGLVEWPVVLMGRIGEDFLGLPPEVLQTSMREHQKFFSVRNPRTGRIEGFVTVANTETSDQGATILKGNQKVLAARLSDAKFFWENDLREAKAGMGKWLEGLTSVTFHNKLGSQADRIERIAALAREIAPLVGADPAAAEQAARLAKADLRSGMVGEFPELQGIMGRYYVHAALSANPPRPPSRGLDLAEGGPGSGPGRAVDAIANAARDHYAPLGPSDAVPSEPVSVAVALADKIDTLTGFWAIDEKPTGSKDPFALRRAALGVIRLVLGNGVRLEFAKILHESRDIAVQQEYEKSVERLTAQFVSDYSEATQTLAELMALQVGEVTHINQIWSEIEEAENRTQVSENQAHQIASAYAARAMQVGLHATWILRDDLLSFFHDRLKVFLKDQGIRHDVIDACLAMPGNDDLTLLVKRAEALAAFLKTDDGENLLQGFKRANNILTQAEAKDGVEYSYGADVKFAETDEERTLFAALDTAEAAIQPAMKAEDFGQAMSAMARLRAPIDAFFTAVQVNADNPVVRRNRLNLLSRIRTICLSVADLTKLEG